VLDFIISICFPSIQDLAQGNLLKRCTYLALLLLVAFIFLTFSNPDIPSKHPLDWCRIHSPTEEYVDYSGKYISVPGGGALSLAIECRWETRAGQMVSDHNFESFTRNLSLTVSSFLMLAISLFFQALLLARPDRFFKTTATVKLVIPIAGVTSFMLLNGLPI
jgi:hypothetical protein